MAKLYYVPNASSLAAHIVLEWCGVDFTAVPCEFLSQELKDLHPIGSAGVLELPDGTRMSQISAILRYLARTNPNANLGGGGDPLEAYQLDHWSSFLVSDVHPPFHPMFFSERYGVDGVEAARNALLELCYRNFGVLDVHLAGKTYMLGDRKSVLDALVLPMIRWSYVQFPEEKRNLTNVNALHDRLLEDPGVIRAMETEGIVGAITR